MIIGILLNIAGAIRLPPDQTSGKCIVTYLIFVKPLSTDSGIMTPHSQPDIPSFVHMWMTLASAAHLPFVHGLRTLMLVLRFPIYISPLAHGVYAAAKD